MLSLNRFERRYFSKHFFSFIEKYPKESVPDDEILTARRQFYLKDIGYLFILHSDKLEFEHIKLLLETAFLSYQVFTKYEYKKYILIGVNLSINQFKIFYTDIVEPFDKQYEHDIMHDAKLFGWYQDLKMFRGREQEYPDI